MPRNKPSKHKLVLASNEKALERIKFSEDPNHINFVVVYNANLKTRQKLRISKPKPNFNGEIVLIRNPSGLTHGIAFDKDGKCLFYGHCRETYPGTSAKIKPSRILAMVDEILPYNPEIDLEPDARE